MGFVVLESSFRLLGSLLPSRAKLKLNPRLRRDRQPMSGRSTQHCTWVPLDAFLSVIAPSYILQPHDDVAPTRTVDVIHRDEDDRRKLVPMRWGQCDRPVSLT